MSNKTSNLRSLIDEAMELLESGQSGFSEGTSGNRRWYDDRSRVLLDLRRELLQPVRHERRVIGHVSGWQEQMPTCVCGQPWPCSSVETTSPHAALDAWIMKWTGYVDPVTTALDELREIAKGFSEKSK